MLRLSSRAKSNPSTVLRLLLLVILIRILFRNLGFVSQGIRFLIGSMVLFNAEFLLKTGLLMYLALHVCALRPHISLMGTDSISVRGNSFLWVVVIIF